MSWGERSGSDCKEIEQMGSRREEVKEADGGNRSEVFMKFVFVVYVGGSGAEKPGRF